MPNRRPAAPSAPLAIAFREVRHDQPDDFLHYEPIAVRGRLHQWQIPAHRHEGLHQFQLLERGAALVTIDGVATRLRAPAGLMLAAGAVHAFTFEPDSAGHQVTVPSALLWQSLAATPSLNSRLAGSFVLAGTAFAADAAEGVDLFERLAREFQLSSVGRSEALRAHVLLLALWFLRHADETAPDDRRRALRDTLVQRYRALLELQFRRHRPVSFYAEGLHVSADHLSRACRAVTGLSALDLMHDRVLLEARRLLAYTPAAVADIAADLGFDDAAYFSRFFTRRAGQSPSAFRRLGERGLADAPAAG
jgi:AraC family transcriptional activator of pobA